MVAALGLRVEERQICFDLSVFLQKLTLWAKHFYMASVPSPSVCLQANLFPGALVYFGSDVKTGLCLFGSFLSYADFELDTAVLLRNVI